MEDTTKPRLVKIPCGCAFPERKAAILLWLIKRKWFWLFDIVHGPTRQRNIGSKRDG